MTDCSDCQGTGYVSSVEPVFCQACDSTGTLLDSKCDCCTGNGFQLIEIKTRCARCYPDMATAEPNRAA